MGKLDEALFAGLMWVAYQMAPARSVAGEVRTVLAVSCTALGDTLLSTPAIRSLRLAYPQARLVLLVHPTLYSLFASHPDADQVLSYSGGWGDFLPTLRTLRKLNVDVACILHGNEPQVTPLVWLAGARRIYKLPNHSRFRFLLSNRDSIAGWDQLGHGVDIRLATAQLAGGCEVERRMVVAIGEPVRAETRRWFADYGLPEDARIVALHPGASTVSRRWPAERYAALARDLLARSRRTWVVLTGSPAEAALTRRIRNLVGSDRLLDAAGQVPIAMLPAFIKHCAAFVCGDTGPMHVAVAVGTPVVALFAVSDHRRSGPSQDLERHVVIQKWRTCDPCLSKRCPYAEPPCMGNITVDEVVAGVERALAEAAA